MKKYIFLLLILFTGSSALMYGQTAIKNNTILNQIKSTPQEKIFVHYNTSLLFAGEYLYYKIYTFISDTNKLSGLSKIAYVELVGENGNRVFRQKISLKNGLGQGDFFIPTSVPSGNYKLLAYTQWMLNEGIKNSFRGNVVVINPYQGNQAGLSSTSGNESKPASENNTQNYASSDHEFLKLEISDDTFEKREQVDINLKSLQGRDAFGNYSLSVRRISDIENPVKYSAQNYTSLYQNQKGNSIREGDSIYLPELRGDLIIGKLNLQGEKENLVTADQNIAFSIPEDNIIRIVSTDESGNFRFSIANEYFGTHALVQVLGENSSNYGIKLDEGPHLNYSALKFEPFNLMPNMKETILERSIHNQVQNSYFEVKSDTIKLPLPPKPFYGDLLITYDLEKFDRFKTLRTTFIEIIKSAWIKRNDEGELVFEVKDYQTNNGFNAKTMLLVDGLLVQDHGDLVDYNAYKVDNVGVVRNVYHYGPKTFQGIVTIETNEDNFYKTYRSGAIEKVTLNPPEPTKNYYHQSYGPGENFKTHIPDFRSQLLWQPHINLKTEELTFEFYTSDVPGDYEIVLEGFTTNGKPVSIKKVIRVE